LADLGGGIFHYRHQPVFAMVLSCTTAPVLGEFLGQAISSDSFRGFNIKRKERCFVVLL
jgi:hypothetical protein